MSKILICEGALNSQYSYAGRERMIKWVGNAMAGFSHEVVFCTTYDDKRPQGLCPEIDSITLGMSYHSSFFKRNILFFILYPFKINKIVKKIKCDYVLSFGDTSFFVLLFLKLFFSYKLVVSERSDPYYNNNTLDRFRRLLYKYADVLIFQTEGARDYFSEKIKLKSFIIPNPISLPPEEWKYENQKNMIATVGRIDFWQKRQDLLIKSFARVVERCPDWILNIYGSGNDFLQMKNLVEKLKLTENIILHGAVKDVVKKLLDNKLFVLSSDFEGIPNALLEAMSIGMPVISTDCSPGGAAFLLKEKNNGYLVPRDNVELLAEAIIHVIENYEEAVQRGNNARKSLYDFSEDKISKMWNRIFV